MGKLGSAGMWGRDTTYDGGVSQGKGRDAHATLAREKP